MNEKTVARLIAALAVVDKNDGCWLWQGQRDNGGYGHLYRGGERYMLAHRASWRFHRGEIPAGQYVLHRCDARACVNPDHLFLGTQLENIADREAKGRGGAAQGASNGGAKLTENDVVDIRTLHAFGAQVRGLAAEYDLSRRQVYKIVTRQAWALSP